MPVVQAAEGVAVRACSTAAHTPLPCCDLKRDPHTTSRGACLTALPLRLPPAFCVQASGEGVPRPAASPLAAGKWRLLWTRQGQTANPLQKALANQAGYMVACCGTGETDGLLHSLQGGACAAALPPGLHGSGGLENPLCHAYGCTVCAAHPSDRHASQLDQSTYAALLILIPWLQVENFQLISEDGGRLENLVCLLPGLRVRASAACGPEEGDSRTRVDIDEASTGPWVCGSATNHSTPVAAAHRRCLHNADILVCS